MAVRGRLRKLSERLNHLGTYFILCALTSSIGATGVEKSEKDKAFWKLNFAERL